VEAAGCGEIEINLTSIKKQFMKTKVVRFLTLLLVSAVSLVKAQQVEPPKSAADIPGTPAGTIITEEYVETVGRLAYLWGWPLVNNYNPPSG